MCNRSSARAVCFVAIAAAWLIVVPPVSAQSAPAAMDRMTFDEAVRLAVERNPTVAQAAEAILRAEGLLQQARAATRPSISGLFSTSTLDTGRSFSGTVVQPRSQATFSVDLSVPVLAASRWAASNQARDQIEVAAISTADVRRQVAVATAQAYLGIIAQQRQVEVILRARDAARAHLLYAQRRLESGAGTRLNELRAAQEVSGDDARLENAGLGVRRAQEALGVLTAADGPVDAAGEPTFEPPAPAGGDAWMAARTDVRLAEAVRRAFERVWHDSTKDYFPTAIASFDPQALAPSGAFTASRSWRFTVSATQPIFDGGQRKGVARVRQTAVESARLAVTSSQIRARSEVRLAQETVQSSERALASVRLSSQQAGEVLTITTTAFEAGATTNLEVIDAQRSARDAEASVAIAEDAVRRARLDLLTALGQFPR